MKAPASLDVDNCRLICQKCGQPILFGEWREWSYGSWAQMEDDALQARYNITHTCTITVNVEAARESMRAYRADHPGLSFEEECVRCTMR